MKAKRTYQPEPRVEINLETFKRSAREAIHTFFTPVRVLFWILVWPFRQIARVVRPPHPTPTRKETSVGSQG